MAGALQLGARPMIADLTPAIPVLVFVAVANWIVVGRLVARYRGLMSDASAQEARAVLWAIFTAYAILGAVAAAGGLV